MLQTSTLTSDVISVHSAHVPDLPLVFVLGLLSPPAPSYIHNTYPVHTLSLLDIETYSLPGGIAVLDKVIAEVFNGSEYCSLSLTHSQTFFHPDFSPEVMLGPATLEYIVDFFTRHAYSIDGVLTMLQVRIRPYLCTLF